jgi:diadenosine tetraphosphatase ApaH/serine/threonine PP2A family protein phosphatase
MIEQFSCYKFEIEYDIKFGWFYIIHGSGCPPYDDGKIESDDFFDTEQEARFAVIGHITLLENGGS